MSSSPARALTLFVFRKFAIAVLVLVLAFILAGCGKSRSDRIWEKLTESTGEGEITTTVMEDGAVIQSYALYESFR